MRVNKLLSGIFMGIMTLSLVACGNQGVTKDIQQDNQQDNQQKEAIKSTDSLDTENLTGTIVITGSTSVEKILNDMIDEFTALNPDVLINYTGTGSSAGIADTLKGTNTIGVSSREIKDEEKVNNLVTEVFAYDGIAVVVNPSNKVTDITKDNLAKIFSGEITNWSQVGGADAEIVPVSREGSSGTRSSFEELVKLEDAGGLTENATVVEGNGSAQTTVAENEHAIGYVSFSYVDSTVSALSVDGVDPTAEHAKAGTYRLSRPFLFVYVEDAISAEGKAFIDYAISADGQEFVKEHGGIKID